MNETPSSRPRGRRTLLLLAVIFLGPLALSFWLYYGTSWRPVGDTNHGQLIDPARPLPALALPDLQGAAAPARWFDDKWSMVVVGHGACDEDCRRSLVFARQIWLGLGRSGSRVQRVFLATDPCCDRDYLQREHAGLLTLDGSAATAAPLLAQVPAQDRSHMIFIVDPLGNLMMRYDSRLEPKGLRADLKKLLGLSHIG